MDGVELCRRVRAASREPYIYILLLTGRTESEDLVEGMEAGADDYLTKPFNAQELRVRLRAGHRILDLQEELVAAREALRDQATHDGLTGLLNRVTILDALRSELGRSTRERRPVAVLMVDLDHFKAGQRHPRSCGRRRCTAPKPARRMKFVVRPYDSVGPLRRRGVPDGAGRVATPSPPRPRPNVSAEALASEPIAFDGHSIRVTCASASPARPAFRQPAATPWSTPPMWPISGQEPRPQPGSAGLSLRAGRVLAAAR